MALFSCQNQITKCTLCHEKHLKIFVLYLLNDFHADSFFQHAVALCQQLYSVQFKFN